MVVGAGDIPRLLSQVRRATRAPKSKYPSLQCSANSCTWLMACVYGSEKQTRPMLRLKRAKGDASDRRRLPKHMNSDYLHGGGTVGLVALDGSTRNKTKVVALRHKSRRSFDERDSADSSAETMWFRASKNMSVPSRFGSRTTRRRR